MSHRTDLRTRVVSLALEQRGVITTQQLLGLGLSSSAIQRQLDAGFLVTLYPATHRLCEVLPNWEQSLQALCLWAGDGAVASHRAAAHLHGLLDGAVPAEIYAPSRRKTPGGVVVHHTDRLEPCDVTSVRGIPSTTPSRTLVDLGAVVPRYVVLRATETAFRDGLTSPWHLVGRLDALAKPGRRGVRAIRQVLRERDPRLAPTESELETILWQVLTDSRSLPVPVRQLVISDEEGFVGRVDLAYPEHRVVVEAQSAMWHLTRERWLNDMERRNRLTLMGWRVLEIPWQEVVRRPSKVVDRVCRVLFEATAA